MPADEAAATRLDRHVRRHELTNYLAGPPTVALDHDSVAEMCDISSSHLFALIRRGVFGPTPIYLGRSKRYLREEVGAWLRAGAPPRHRWLAMREAPTSDKGGGR